MHNLLIIDDEEIIRKGLKTMIEGLGFEFASIIEAENGIKAIDAVDKYNPEIIISDIRMPVMDGLQFIKIIRDRNYNSHIILLSGYNEFEYAKQALSHNVLEYLLKPVQRQELDLALKKAIKELKKEKEKEMFITKQSELLRNAISDLTKKKLEEIVTANRKKYGSFSQFLASEGICMSHTYFMVLYGYMSCNSSLKHAFITLDWQNHIKRKITALYKNVLIFSISGTDVTIIINCNEDVAKADIEALLDDINASLSGEGIRMSWGISDKSSNADDVPKLFSRSKNALKEKTLYGPGKIYFAEKLQPGYELAFTETDIIKIVSFLETGDNDKLFEYIRIKLDEPLKKRMLRGNSFENGLYSLYLNIASRLKGNESADSAVGNDLQEFGEGLSCCGNIYDALKLFEETLFKMFTSCRNNKRQPTVKKSVDFARLFIQKNYFKEINLDMVANHVSMNPSYFSVLFKKESGMNLVDYINDVRIGKAMEYLCDPQYKVYEVAGKVGFGDEKYFSKIFKKKTGLTPKEYKNKSML